MEAARGNGNETRDREGRRDDTLSLILVLFWHKKGYGLVIQSTHLNTFVCINRWGWGWGWWVQRVDNVEQRAVAGTINSERRTGTDMQRQLMSLRSIRHADTECSRTAESVRFQSLTVPSRLGPRRRLPASSGRHFPRSCTAGQPHFGVLRHR